jgi:ketosteroid isomerase-like protein
MGSDVLALFEGCHNDPLIIVEGFEAAVMQRDVDLAMSYFHPDVLVNIRYHDLALPFVGSTKGVDMARARLTMVFRDWTFLERNATLKQVDPETVRSHVNCVIRHNRTRATFHFTFREVWKIEGGRIKSCDQWSDIHLIKSFLRMIESWRQGE